MKKPKTVLTIRLNGEITPIIMQCGNCGNLIIEVTDTMPEKTKCCNANLYCAICYNPKSLCYCDGYVHSKARRTALKIAKQLLEIEKPVDLNDNFIIDDYNTPDDTATPPKKKIKK